MPPLSIKPVPVCRLLARPQPYPLLFPVMPGVPYTSRVPSSLRGHGDPQVRELVMGGKGERESPITSTMRGIISLPSAGIKLTAYSVREIILTRTAGTVLLYFACAVALGWLLNHEVGTDFDPHALYDVAQIWFLAGGLWIGFDWSVMHMLDRGFQMPLDGATLVPRVDARPSMTLDSNSCMGPLEYFYVPRYRNTHRFILQIPVVVFGCATLALWRRLAQSDTPTTQAEYGQVVDKLRTVQNLTMLWVVLVPSLTTGVLEYWSTRNRSDGPALLTMWSFLSVILKGFLFVVSYVIMDPIQTSLWDHRSDQPVVLGEKVTITIVSGLMVLGCLLFWARYAREHMGFGDRLFAYTDYSATLALVMLVSWQYTARMRGQHVPTDREILPMMFALQVTFFTLQIISTQTIPPEVHSVRADIPTEHSLMGENEPIVTNNIGLE